MGFRQYQCILSGVYSVMGYTYKVGWGIPCAVVNPQVFGLGILEGKLIVGIPGC